MKAINRLRLELPHLVAEAFPSRRQFAPREQLEELLHSLDRDRQRIMGGARVATWIGRAGYVMLGALVLPRRHGPTKEHSALGFEDYATSDIRSSVRGLNHLN